MSHDIACPICGTELTIIQLFASETTQIAVSRMIAVGMPLGAKVLQYITLFSPPKTRLTVPKQIKLMLQLLPDLERRAITHKGRDWAVPLTVWAQAIDQMLASRDAGRLELPMTGHGYLYSILVGLADKVEARAETQAEADKRRAPAFGSQLNELYVSTQSIGQGLAQVYGRDPELAKRENDRRNAAPMPDATRAEIARLRGTPVTPKTTSGEKA